MSTGRTRVSAPEPRTALAGHLAPGPIGRPGDAGVTLQELHSGLVEIGVRRGQEATLDAALRQALGLGLPAQGRATEAGDVAALRIGPATTLVVAPPARLQALFDGIAPSVAAVIGQSGGFAMLRIAGPMAAAALAKSCRLDLDARVFASGSVARTLIAQMSVVLHRVGDGFDLIVPATVARSFADFLCGAAAEFGCMVLPGAHRTP
jgi:heterotetrameric sarcosine oxidase gamma subunit